MFYTKEYYERGWFWVMYEDDTVHSGPHKESDAESMCNTLNRGL